MIFYNPFIPLFPKKSPLQSTHFTHKVERQNFHSYQKDNKKSTQKVSSPYILSATVQEPSSNSSNTNSHNNIRQQNTQSNSNYFNQNSTNPDNRNNIHQQNTITNLINLIQEQDTIIILVILYLLYNQEKQNDPLTLCLLMLLID